jgi:hypothetical protein
LIEFPVELTTMSVRRGHANASEPSNYENMKDFLSEVGIDCKKLIPENNLDKNISTPGQWSEMMQRKLRTMERDSNTVRSLVSLNLLDLNLDCLSS